MKKIYTYKYLFPAPGEFIITASKGVISGIYLSEDIDFSNNYLIISTNSSGYS